MTSTTIDSNEVALACFADASAKQEERKAALTLLITSKLLPKQSESPAIVRGKELLLTNALKSENPVEKLMAIAESIRLAQVVKRWGPEIVDRLRLAFLDELPEMQLLSDADDRLNFARACSHMEATWLVQYLARSIAAEEAGEKARSEMIEALTGRVQNLYEAIRHLAKAFEALRPTTESPGDTIARRLTRMFSAFRGILLDSELEAGDDLGKALYDLVAVPLAVVGKPQEEKVKIDLTREILLVVHDIVRTRISVISDPTVYRVVEYCRRLFSNRAWPDELKKPLDRLITDVTEALVLLGRQGMCEQPLLEQLSILCNHPERARVVARSLAARHPELPENVRDWLERGKVRVVKQASESALEAAASNADGSIGLALHAARQAKQLHDGLHVPLLSSLEVYEPSMAAAAQELLDRVQILVVQVEQAAIQREIDLYGTLGEEIEMSTKFFTAVGDLPRQRMIVRQPAIVRKRSDGSVGNVITKGLVE